jgi:hypothetical protein
MTPHDHWQAHHGVLQKLQFSEKKFVTKFIHQIVPTGETFHKTEPSQSITCSSCQLKLESGTHLGRCPTRRAAMEDVFLQDPFQTFLQDNHMCPKLAHALLRALCCDCHEACHPQFTSRHGATDLKRRQPHHHQALVGWSQLFQGRQTSDQLEPTARRVP